jgi:hypothetical protein
MIARKLLFVYILAAFFPIFAYAGYFESGEYFLDNCPASLQDDSSYRERYDFGSWSGFVNQSVSCQPALGTSAVNNLAIQYPPTFTYQIEFYSELNGGGSLVTTETIVVSSPNWWEWTSSGGGDLTTRFLYIEPIDEETLATGTISFLLSGYVLPDDDPNDEVFVRLKLSNNGLAAQSAVGPIFAWWSFTGNSPQIFQETFNFTSSEVTTDFTLSTSTLIENLGLYTMKSQIIRPLFSFFGFDIGENVLAEDTRTFIAASTTRFDDLFIKTQEEIENSFLTFDDDCEHTIDSFFGTFNFIDLTWCLLVPNPAQMSNIKDSYINTLFEKVPFGYLTQAISIFNASTTTPLPDLSYTFPSDFPAPLFAGKDITFKVWDYFYVDGAPVKDEWVSNVAGDEKNVWEIFEPLYTTIVYLFLSFKIITELANLNSHDGGGQRNYR